MSNLSRIDPQAVAAWFQAHPNIMPVQKRFTVSQDVCGKDRLVGCCGLTSQTLKHVPRGAVPAFVPSLKGLEGFASALGLDSRYAAGFVNGWDGREDSNFSGRSFAGHVDGRAAYIATLEAIKP